VLNIVGQPLYVNISKPRCDNSRNFFSRSGSAAFFDPDTDPDSEKFNQFLN
jgi:hypothetical protein